MLWHGAIMTPRPNVFVMACKLLLLAHFGRLTLREG
jgi:hypothetical protein